jgi:hypothetical protein
MGATLIPGGLKVARYVVHLAGRRHSMNLRFLVHSSEVFSVGDSVRGKEHLQDVPRAKPAPV